MREVTVDCAAHSPARLHQALAQKLDFPDWYGNNLDALYDCLTDLEEQTRLTLLNLENEGFRQTVLDAAQVNPLLSVELE